MTHATFFITYFLILYRAILLNTLEFGKCRSTDYPKIYARLKTWWNIKVTIIFTITVSIPYLLIFALYSSDDSAFEFFNIYSENTAVNVGTGYYYFIVCMECLCYCSLFCYTLQEIFRLTIRIDLFLNALIWAAYLSNRMIMPSFINYSIYLPLRNFSLHMIIIISSRIRNRFVKIPDPPLYHEPYVFLYEHRLFYNSLHEFMETFEDKMYLDCLDLGLYINIYRFQGKNRYLRLVNELCKKHGLLEFNNMNFLDTEIFIKENIESIFPMFFNSVYYQQLSDTLSAHSKAIYF